MRIAKTSHYHAGTRGYMAPEQYEPRFGLYGTHSDVFLVGQIMYELATLEPAHDNIAPPTRPPSAPGSLPIPLGTAPPFEFRAIPDRPGYSDTLRRAIMLCLPLLPGERIAPSDLLRITRVGMLRSRESMLLALKSAASLASLNDYPEKVYYRASDRAQIPKGDFLRRTPVRYVKWARDAADLLRLGVGGESRGAVVEEQVLSHIIRDGSIVPPEGWDSEYFAPRAAVQGLANEGGLGLGASALVVPPEVPSVEVVGRARAPRSSETPVYRTSHPLHGGLRQPQPQQGTSSSQRQSSDHAVKYAADGRLVRRDGSSSAGFLGRGRGGESGWGADGGG